MSDMINIEVNQDALQNLIKAYSEEKVQKIVQTTQTFTQKVQRDARELLKKQGRVDSGQLINHIKQQVNIYNNKVVGQVYSTTKYARFIHEGAKHKGAEIVPFFVSFKVAPSLRQWAMRKGVIYQKRKDGQKRKSKKSGDQWYMTSKRTGKEYAIDIEKGGFSVKITPTKFFQVPFEKYKGQYLQKIRHVMEGKND